MSKTTQNKIQKLYFSDPHKVTGQNWGYRGVKIYFSLTIQCILPDKLQVIGPNLIFLQKPTLKPKILNLQNIYLYMYVIFVNSF